jgi:hypothetical protein
MRHLRLLLFLLGCLCLSPAHAQYFKWREAKSSRFYRLDFAKQEIFQCNDGFNWEYVAKATFKDVIPTDLLSTDRGVKEIPIPNTTDQFYLTIHCTGQVYKLNKATWEFQRIDRTFFRGANCTSYQFLRKGKIYSFGGYGFWQSTNVLSEFSFKGGEWLSIQAEGDIPKAITFSPSGYSPEKDRFVTLANSKLNDTEQHNSTIFDWNIYEYNFDNKEFKSVGVVNMPVMREFFSKDIGKNYLFNGRYFVIIDLVQQVNNFDSVIIIDVLDGYKVYRWRNPERVHIRDGRADESLEKLTHLVGDTLVYTNSPTSYPYRTAGHAKLPITRLLAESDYLGPLTQDTWVNEFWKIGLIALGFVVFIFSLTLISALRKRRKKQQLQILLGENEKQFMDFMLLNFRQGYVSGHQIVAFFGKHKSSPESQRQFRAKLFDNFTKAIGLIYPGKEILDIQTDEKDQRMLVYRLHADMYDRLSRL